LTLTITDGFLLWCLAALSLAWLTVVAHGVLATILLLLWERLETLSSPGIAYFASLGVIAGVAALGVAATLAFLLGC